MHASMFLYGDENLYYNNSEHTRWITIEKEHSKFTMHFKDIDSIHKLRAACEDAITANAEHEEGNKSAA